MSSGPARRGGASAREVFYQDFSVALGPGVTGAVLVGALKEAHVVSGALAWVPVWWLAVPFAVVWWHASERPAPPPPAGAARRVLTVAAAALSLAVAGGGVVVGVVFIAGGGLSWWYLPVASALWGYSCWLGARSSVRNWRPVPPAVARSGAGAGEAGDSAAEGDGLGCVAVALPPWGPSVPPPGS